MAADVEITELAPAAIDEVRSLWLAMRDRHGELTPGWEPLRDDDDSWARKRAAYLAELEAEGSFVLVARSEGRVLGYALVSIERTASATWRFDEYAFLDSVCVLPEARGRGIGSALLAAVQERVAALGLARIHLDAVAANAEAIRLYERAGFAVEFVTMVKRRGG